MPRVLCASLLAACSAGPVAVGEARPAEVARPFLRVVTFNLFNRPWEREARLRAQLATLKELDADLVALQEVATGVFLGGDPAAIFARELDLRGVRFWHEENLGLFRTGLGLLSRFPLRDAEYHDFAEHQLWDAKGYLSATVVMPRGSISVVNVHLASTRDARIKESEFAELARHVRKLRPPVLLLGDFNTEPHEPVFVRFIAAVGADPLYRHLRGPHPTWNDWSERDCSKPGGELIDHVLSIGALRFREGRIVVPRETPPPSDHCPVMAEVDL